MFAVTMLLVNKALVPHALTVYILFCEPSTFVFQLLCPSQSRISQQCLWDSLQSITVLTTFILQQFTFGQLFTYSFSYLILI